MPQRSSFELTSQQVENRARLNPIAHQRIEIPIVFAVKYGQVDMVRWLLEHGAKLDILASDEELKNLDKTVGDQIYAYAKAHKQKSIIDILRRYGLGPKEIDPPMVQRDNPIP
jgi:hypothetical protein